MHDLDLVLARCERQHSVIGRRQLRAMGWSQAAVLRLWHSRRFEPITVEVARLVGSVRTDGQRAMAAVLDTGGDAHLGFDTAAAWWGVAGARLDPLEIVSTKATRHPTTLARTHRVRVLPAAWTATLRDIPIVRPELLALQMFAVHPPARAERRVERLWAMRLLSGRSIAAFLAELGERGRNGTAGLRSYLDARGPDYIPSATNIETRTQQILRRVGIEMRPQVDSGSTAWTGRVDLRHAIAPLIVEVQSSLHHDALTDEIADRRRREQLERDGFVVVEAWDHEVWADPDAVVARVWAGLDLALTRSASRSNRQTD